MATKEIDFETMEVGDVRDMPHPKWEGSNIEVFRQANEFARSKGGAPQFVVDRKPDSPDGFILTRIR